MAENGREILEQSKPSVDKDFRVRSLKDRQNEERQRKLEEIKAQALAAQRFKEQKEQERRRRLEDTRQRDDVRRMQVEERKKAINEAERDRLEFIIKRNHVREQRMESRKRNERSNVVFAFGSSTPRMLEPADMAVSFWGARRATSIQNIVSSTNSSSSLTRRQSERDLDVGNKKRATSATGLERTAENNGSVVPAGCASGYLGRRRTDLVPTVPTRDPALHSSRKSLNHSPGRAYSMTRLDQLARPRRRPDLPALAEHAHALPPRPLSSSRVSSSMSHLAGGLSRSVSHLMSDMPRATRSSQLREQKLSAATGCSEASSRPSSSLSQQSTNSVASSASVRHRMSAAPRKPRPVSIAVTGVTHDLRNDTAKPPLPRARRVIGKAGERTEKSDKAGEKSDRAGEKSDKASEKSDKPGEKREKGDRVGERNEKERVAAAPRPKVKSPVDVASKAGENAGQVVSKDETQQKPPDIAPVISQVNEQNLEENGKLEESITDAGANIKDDPNKENVPESKKSDIELVSESRVVDKVEIVEDNMREGIKEESREMERQVVTKIDTAEIKSEEKREGIKSEEPPQTLPVSLPNTNEVSNGENIETSENIESNSVNEMTASMTKIRITTEEEAKAALAERRRLIREEAERQAEMERLRIEAEAKAEIERQQREEEQVRHLIELQRQTEQERLQEAIRETQKREEEERLRREEEQRLKVLKEESDRKAKEEAEKQKAELQEKLKNEEKEREARRKRVEAIMLRTRGKNNANLPSQQSTDDKNNENKSDENKDNDSKVNGTKIVEQQENGTTNSSEDADIVDNIIPSEIVKNANTVTIETMNSSDSLNSNNSWRGSQQYGNFVCNNNS